MDCLCWLLADHLSAAAVVVVVVAAPPIQPFIMSCLCKEEFEFDRVFARFSNYLLHIICAKLEKIKWTKPT